MKGEIEIKTVLILVELQDGSIRQVLANQEMKMAMLHLLKDEKSNSLLLSEESVPIQIDKRT